MIPHLNCIKENCMGCQKSIMLHNKIITCSSCNKIAHGKCAKSIFEHNHLENSWICFDCGSNKQKRYNIFSTSYFDKYDPNSLHHIEDLHELSKVLNSCEKYDIKKFRNLSKSIDTSKTIFPVSAITLMAMLPTLIALQLKYSVNTEIASLLLQLQKLILMSAIKISIN